MGNLVRPAPARLIIPIDVYARMVLSLKSITEHLNLAVRPLPPIAEGLPDATLHELECLAGHVGDLEQLFRICLEESS